MFLKLRIQQCFCILHIQKESVFIGAFSHITQHRYYSRNIELYCTFGSHGFKSHGCGPMPFPQFNGLLCKVLCSQYSQPIIHQLSRKCLAEMNISVDWEKAKSEVQIEYKWEQMLQLTVKFSTWQQISDH